MNVFHFIGVVLIAGLTASALAPHIIIARRSTVEARIAAERIDAARAAMAAVKPVPCSWRDQFKGGVK